MAEPVKVAFTGDQGAGEGARAVLSLIANEGADLLMLQGDLGYGDGKATTWEENLTQALGADFPVLTVVGNHENFEWPLYKRFIQQRIDRVDGLSCTGDTGVRALCNYKNIEVVQVSPGIHEVEGVNGDENYADFINASFAEPTNSWRICAWHKNQSAMQTGSKSDATGWGVYDACLDVGAMIALAHEHAYSRSYLLSDFRNQSIVHKNSEMGLEPGKSFAFVSGLGGHEVRDQAQGGDWWASIYTGSQAATHGALFCTFEETTADCYFKAIDGAVPDQFTLTKPAGGAPSAPVTEVSGSESVTPDPQAEQASADAAAPETTAEVEPDAPESQPEILETAAIEEPLDDSNSAPDVDAPEAVEPEAVEPEVVEPEVAATEVVEPEAVEPEAVQEPLLAADPVAPDNELAAASDETGVSTGGSGSFSLFLLLALTSQLWLRRAKAVEIRSTCPNP